jgi:hypothetical protein
MACKNCPMKYVGQTGWTFRARYKEHIREIRQTAINKNLPSTCLTHPMSTIP